MFEFEQLPNEMQLEVLKRVSHKNVRICLIEMIETVFDYASTFRVNISD